MNCRKLALLVGAAASCAGCVTETKSVPMTAEMASKVNVKEAVYPKRQAQPQTWIAVGELYEAKAGEQKADPAQLSVSQEEARKAYQKAIEIDPKCVSAHIHLGNLYLHKDDPDRALAVYQRALQQNPNTASLWYEKSLVYRRSKDWNGTLECLAKAHELEAQNRQYASDYGLCLARANRPEEAVTALSTVMNKAEANYNVARMMAHIDQPDVSKQYLQAALTERPAHAGSLELLAELNGNPTGPRPSLAAPQFESGVERASWNSPH